MYMMYGHRKACHTWHRTKSSFVPPQQHTRPWCQIWIKHEFYIQLWLLNDYFMMLKEAGKSHTNLNFIWNLCQNTILNSRSVEMYGHYWNNKFKHIIVQNNDERIRHVCSFIYTIYNTITFYGYPIAMIAIHPSC